MDAQLSYVEFQSDSFSAYEQEKLQTNPSVYGKRLAELLGNKLCAEGIAAQAPVAEDWGWLVPIENKEYPIWIGCEGNQENPRSFLCFIEPHTPTVRHLLKTMDVRERIESLQQVLDKVLTEAGVQQKRCGRMSSFNGHDRAAAGPALPSVAKATFLERRFVSGLKP